MVGMNIGTHSLMYIVGLLKRSMPHILDAIPHRQDASLSSIVAYSNDRSRMALQNTLTPMLENTTVPYHITCARVEWLLMTRYGVRMCEVLCPRVDQEYMIARQFCDAPIALRRALVDRLDLIGCTILRYASDTFLATITEDALWRSSMHYIAMLCARKVLVFLDGPPNGRRNWYHQFIQPVFFFSICQIKITVYIGANRYWSPHIVVRL